jgi:serine/threonine-protein kinase
MALAIGTRVGRFELTGILGAGGMGEVYRARDTSLSRDVALKVVPDQLLDADRLVRFTREAQTLASLNHPNIGAIHGLEQLDGRPVLVLELVEGATLADRIAQGALPPGEAISIARQISEAVETAHEQGIVHRDLKPANVKLRPDGLVKVLDFGLAKLAVSADGSDSPANNGDARVVQTLSPTVTSPAMTGVGVILGTAAYMSPEQASGKQVDKRSDIWSFGVVLWEMLTGQRLFGDGESPSHVIADVLRAPIDFETIPAGPLRELLRRCLDRNVKTRLRDIGEARVVLSAPADSEATGQHVVVRRNTAWRVWTLAAALAAAAAMLTWAQWPVAEPEQSAMPMRFNVDLGADVALPPTSNSNTIAVSPDGTRLVFIASIGSNDVSKLYVKRLDSLTDQPPTELPGTERVVSVAFSPDGQSLAFIADSIVYRTSVDGGAPLRLADAESPATQVTWGEGDVIIVSGLGRGLLRVAPRGVLKPLTQLASDEIIHAQPSVMPGGKTVLFIAGRPGADEATVEAVSIDGGARKLILPNGASPRYLPTGHLMYLHRNTLFAVRFDPERLELTGEPVPVVDDVKITLAGQFEVGGFSVDTRGTLVYRQSTGITTSLRLGTQEPGTIDVLTGKSHSALVASVGSYIDPDMSPDDAELAMTVVQMSAMDVAVFDARRDTAPRRLTLNGVSSDAVWIQKDRRYVVFVSASSNAVTRQRGRLYWMRSDGGEAQLLLPNTGVTTSGSFDPASSRLAYVAVDNEPGHDQAFFNIFLVKVSEEGGQLKAGQPERFTSQAFAMDPEFSPDGRWIAFTANRRAGRTEIWVRAVMPGKDGTRFERQISVDGGRNPRWSRNRQELLYQSGNQIIAVRFTVNGDTLQPDKPVVRVQQFGGTSWDMTRDDRIVAVTPVKQPKAAAAAPEHHVVFLQNFFEWVRRRVK